MNPFDHHKVYRPLKITLHSQSIFEDQKTRTLLKYKSFELLDFIAIPSKRIDLKVPHMQYQDARNGFIVQLRNVKAFCGKRGITSPDFVNFIFQDSGKRTEQKKQALKDVHAHETLSRDIFVTSNKDVLRNKDKIEPRFDVKIFSLPETLDYIDLYLKFNGLFYASPEDFALPKFSYYWFRTTKLLPAFSKAWNIAVFGQSVIKNGSEIIDYLESFSSRFENILCIRDILGIESNKTPNNNTVWEMQFYFNYFVTLVTGLFDCLAWLTNLRYDLNLNRMNITLRKGDRFKEFIKTVSSSNPSLCSFLRQPSNRSLINLHYPLWDSFQHRKTTGGLTAEDWSSDYRLKLSLMNIDEAALAKIKALDKPAKDTHVSKWGLWASRYLEPYQFSRTTLKELAVFSNDFLQRLNFFGLIKDNSEVQTKIRKAEKNMPLDIKKRKFVIDL